VNTSPLPADTSWPDYGCNFSNGSEYDVPPDAEEVGTKADNRLGRFRTIFQKRQIWEIRGTQLSVAVTFTQRPDIKMADFLGIRHLPGTSSERNLLGIRRTKN